MATLSRVTGCTRCCEDLVRAEPAKASMELSLAQAGSNDTFFNRIQTSGINITGVKPRGGPDTSLGK